MNFVNTIVEKATIGTDSSVNPIFQLDYWTRLMVLFLFLCNSALHNAVAETEAQIDTAKFLPFCNTEADRPEDVYPFDQCILFILNIRHIWPLCLTAVFASSFLTLFKCCLKLSLRP